MSLPSAPADDAAAPPAPPAPAKYTILQQDVDLDLDFALRCVRGTTRIVVQPLEAELREVQFACRQMTVRRVKVDRFVVPNFEFADPYAALRVRDEYSVHQHHWISDTVTQGFTHKVEADLKVPLPPKLRLLNSDRIMLRTGAVSFAPALDNAGDEASSKYRPFKVEIEYELRQLRDGLHWVGMDDGDHRFPHVYTYSNSLAHTLANYVFPCVDQADKKYPWKVSITAPRTLGDLYAPSSLNTATTDSLTNGTSDSTTNGVNGNHFSQTKHSPFTAAEKALELQVVCSGYMEDSDAPTANNDARRKWIFSCATPVLPRHIGFAVGPFEDVDLSQYRESEQDDKMGMSAVSVHGFCLPGRSNELRNTCMPLASALDKISTAYVFYPFESEQSCYNVVFVDDLPMNVVDTATLSICSSRLLVAENILDPLYESTRELVHAVASQWLGVKVTPQAQDDIWLIVGGSYFMADWFMMTLWGRNEHRFRLKMAADKVHELDVKRPALIYLGAAVEVDPDEYEFMKLKAPLVLSILHHRILKSNGRIGVNRALSRVLFDDQNGKLDDSTIDTSQFQRACEKVSHGRLDAFFIQWIYGRGCPTFRITQRFNKKKLVVEMLIVQVQAEESLSGGTTPTSFMREAKESVEDVEKGELPLLFTGPMTMRIHEADGTPYEHIVDIKELTTKVEIPYNTKYKRLKRNRRARERAIANAGTEAAEAQDDALLYCLGDVLQSEEEMREWDLADWSKEDDDKMNNEHFEWIRLDKDFEWIAKISFNQPHYMFVSQLQQDNDVVAQAESLQYLLSQQPFKLVSTILVRTLMDTRYFYGLRVIAAHALAKCAVPELDWVGFRHLQKAFQSFYCFDNSNMTRSNDFTDLRVYKIQCAIPEAIAKIRDASGRAPDRVKQFFLDTIKFNDNSTNEYSDSFYISTLMRGLARAVAAIGPQSAASRLSDDELFNLTEDEQQRVMDDEERSAKTRISDAEYRQTALEEIQRFRRIDEWIPSYENQYTTTALEGIKNLMLQNLMPVRLKDFLFYTRPQNSAPVRLKAFDCLIDLGAFEEPTVMSYFMVSFFEDDSPYFRGKLWKVIGRAFAEIAIKEDDVVLAPEVSVMDGLVLESTENAAKERQTALAQSQRVQSIDGLISRLKERVGEVQELKEVLLEALRSRKLGIEHFLDLLSLCKILYDEKTEFKLRLRLPSYWSVTHTGHGQVTFRSTRRYRSKPYTKLEERWKKPTPPAAPAPLPTPTITIPKVPLLFLKRPLVEIEKEASPEQKRPRLSSEASSSITIKTPSQAPIVPSPAAVQTSVPVPAVAPVVPPAEPRKIITLSLKQNQNKPAPVTAPSVGTPLKTPTSSILKIKSPFLPSPPVASPANTSSTSPKRPRSKMVTFTLPSSKLAKFPAGSRGTKAKLPDPLSSRKPSASPLAPAIPPTAAAAPAPARAEHDSRASSPSTLSDASSADVPLASTAAARAAHHSTTSAITTTPQQAASTASPAAQPSKPSTATKPPPLTIPPVHDLSAASLPSATATANASAVSGTGAAGKQGPQTPAITPGGSGFKLKLTFGKKT